MTPPLHDIARLKGNAEGAYIEIVNVKVKANCGNMFGPFEFYTLPLSAVASSNELPPEGHIRSTNLYENLPHYLSTRVKREQTSPNLVAMIDHGKEVTLDLWIRALTRPRKTGQAGP